MQLASAVPYLYNVVMLELKLNHDARIKIYHHKAAVSTWAAGSPQHVHADLCEQGDHTDGRNMLPALPFVLTPRERLPFEA